MSPRSFGEAANVPFLVGEHDEISVDCQLSPDGSKKSPGTMRYWKGGVEVFRVSTFEALRREQEGWTVRPGSDRSRR